MKPIFDLGFGFSIGRERVNHSTRLDISFPSRGTCFLTRECGGRGGISYKYIYWLVTTPNANVIQTFFCFPTLENECKCYSTYEYLVEFYH